LTLIRREIENTLANKLDASVGLRALDFGCGNMPYRPLFEHAGIEYVGADRSDNEMATTRVDSSGSVDSPDGAYDVVLSTQVLEHVPSPLEYLDECHRLLKPGGRLILSTHGYWPYHPDPTDFWRWTGEGLKKLIGDSGLTILDFDGLIGLKGVAIHLFQDSTRCYLPRCLRSAYGYCMQRLIMLADRLHTPEERRRDAMVFFLTAKKPDRK